MIILAKIAAKSSDVFTFQLKRFKPKSFKFRVKKGVALRIVNIRNIEQKLNKYSSDIPGGYYS